VSFKRAIVFANGEFHAANAKRVRASNSDYLVCVDGGVRHCLGEGLQPHLLVGDLDSLDDASSASLEQLGTPCLQYPAEKDASDLELALLALAEHELVEVIVLGASGARTDHHLFNWQLIGSRSWPFRLRVVDDYVDARIVDAIGVSVVGAQYPLNKATLNPGSTLGLSNVVKEPRLQVSIESGIVLVMLVHSD